MTHFENPVNAMIVLLLGQSIFERLEEVELLVQQIQTGLYRSDVSPCRSVAEMLVAVGLPAVRGQLGGCSPKSSSTSNIPYKSGQAKMKEREARISAPAKVCLFRHLETGPALDCPLLASWQTPRPAARPNTGQRTEARPDRHSALAFCINKHSAIPITTPLVNSTHSIHFISNHYNTLGGAGSISCLAQTVYSPYC